MCNSCDPIDIAPGHVGGALLIGLSVNVGLVIASIRLLLRTKSCYTLTLIKATFRMLI